MKEDSINSLPSADDEDISSTKTTDTISVRSIGIDDWAVECFNLHELISHRLPRVVRLAEEKPGLVPKKLEPYLNCPLLLHSASRKTVVKCRVLKKKDGGKYTNVGPILIIPENYDGFFGVIPESGRIPNYCSISDIASVMPKRFFTCTKMIAMGIVTSDNKTEKYVQRAVPEASVLKVDGVFSAKWKTQAETGIFKKSQMTYTTPDIQYLKCIDTKGKTVYIPYTTEGKFYTLFDKDVSDQYALYRIKDLLRVFDFPLKVRLIYGTSPIADTEFTNLLCLNSKEEMEFIITSTVGHKRNVLLDIPVITSVFANLPAAEGSALEMDTVQEAITFVNKYASCFKRRIKRSLFKMDEVTEEEEEKEVQNEAKSGKMLQAKINSVNTAATTTQEIPLDLLKDVKVQSAKSDSKESNDWDDNLHKECQDTENMEIFSKKTKSTEKQHMEFEDLGLENSTVV